MRTFLSATVVASLLCVSAVAAAQENVVLVPARRRCHRHWAEGACRYPRIAFDIEGGLNNFNESGPFGFDTGTGSVTHTGPSWGGRVGVELTNWFALNAHYSGMYNGAYDRVAPAGEVGLVTSAFTGEFRLTAPLRYVQPYVFAGVGAYSTSVTGSDRARAATPLHGSDELGVPIGLGVQFPVTRHMSVGAEFTYHRLFGEEFSAREAIGGGDLFTSNAFLRFRL